MGCGNSSPAGGSGTPAARPMKMKFTSAPADDEGLDPADFKAINLNGETFVRTPGYVTVCVCLSVLPHVCLCVQQGVTVGACARMGGWQVH